MPEEPFSFRDFGILPVGLQPPLEKVRCFLSQGRIIGQFIATGIAAALGVGLTVLFALTAPLPLSLLGCAATLMGFAVIVYLATRHDYRWVELDGNTLRAKHLYTGRTIERSVAEIGSLATMTYQVRRIETVVMEKLLGRIKGIEIRFRDGRTPLRIVRADPAMTNAKELIEALLYRMTQVRELEAEIVDFSGQPLVRNIHWKGEQPSIPLGKNLIVILACLMGTALLFGTALGYWGLQEQERHVIGSLPPHEIAVSSLIRNGPGSNRHITVTDFRPGGYAFQSKSGSWTQVWIALFPAGAEASEIKVVLSSKEVRDEDALAKLLQHGRVTGICSAALRSSWGMTLGSELVEANQGCQLSSAWSIEELREPPSAALVTGMLAGSNGCFAAVVMLAMIIFWKAGSQN